VLDEQNGQLPLVPDPVHEIGERGRLARVHSGGRFVQQQDPRLEGERPGHFQPPLVTVGEIAGVLARDLADADEVQQRQGFLMGRPLFAPLSRGTHDRAEDSRFQVRMHRDLDILLGRHQPEEADVLEGPGDAQRGDPAGRQPGDVAPAEQDLPTGDLVEAGQCVEEGRLAGTVRTDQADDPTLGDGEADVVHRHQSTEPHGDAVRA
jgi:hypothetical protein